MPWSVHPGWEETIKDVIWTFDDSSPRFRHEKWRQIFEEQSASQNPLFSMPLGEAAFGFTSWLSKEDLWGRLRTLSQLAILEGEELQKVRVTFEESLERQGTQVDEVGRIAVHGRTVLYWTQKIGE